MSMVKGALQILKQLGLPSQQLNERTALTLLALLNLRSDDPWIAATNRPLGTSPVINYVNEFYNKTYKENTRETFRDESITPMVLAGMLIKNADNPLRSKNSRNNIYQLEETTLELIKSFGTDSWNKNIEAYLADRQTLQEKYAKERDMAQLPITYNGGQEIKISPGSHSLLMKAIIEDFGSRFVPGASLLYLGDTANKWGVFDQQTFSKLGLSFSKTSNMPDVILYYPRKNWLLLIESVTSNGPMHGQRHAELSSLFSASMAPIVYVTAFPTRKTMAKFLPEIAWETEVWCADSPTHLIHFNGDKFLAPYGQEKE